MKKIFVLLLSAVLICACDSRYDEFLRLIPTDDTVPAPMPLLNVHVARSIAGGAIIKFDYPDDDNVRGAVAYYTRNGADVSTKVSRYVDSLVVEGFPNTDSQVIKLASFNVNEVQSDPTELSIVPLAPTVTTVKCEITPTYGGVKIFVEGNESKSDLAVVLLRDDDLSDAALPIRDRKWVEVTTLFTASNKVYLSRRNLDPVEALYGVYVRDHWGNTSAMTDASVTPIPEYKLDKKLFRDAALPDDNCKQAKSTYPLVSLWDDFYGATAENHMFACDEAPRPCWLTINLGQTAHLSRIHTLPRVDYNIWKDAHPRDFEFWGWGEAEEPAGSENLDNPHGFQTGWVLLGAFTQYKPSGYLPDGSVGDYTSEDREYFNAGNDFDLDISKWIHANDAIRYLRVVFVDNFMTYNTGLSTMAVQISEITPYGLPVTE
jgi:hypothetical protein